MQKYVPYWRWVGVALRKMRGPPRLHCIAFECRSARRLHRNNKSTWITSRKMEWRICVVCCGNEKIQEEENKRRPVEPRCRRPFCCFSSNFLKIFFSTGRKWEANLISRNFRVESNLWPVLAGRWQRFNGSHKKNSANLPHFHCFFPTEFRSVFNLPRKFTSKYWYHFLLEKF